MCLSGGLCGSSLLIRILLSPLQGVHVGSIVGSANIGLAVNFCGQSSLQVCFSNLVLRSQCAQTLDGTGDNVSNLLVHILLHVCIRNIGLLFAKVANSSGNCTIHIISSSVSGAHSQGQLARNGVIRSLSHSVAGANHFYRSSAGIQVNLDKSRTIVLGKHIQVGHIIQSSSAWIGNILKRFQIGNLLKITNADTGAIINVQIHSSLIRGHIESALGVGLGKISEQTFLKSNISHSVYSSS